MMMQSYNNGSKHRRPSNGSNAVLLPAPPTGNVRKRYVLTQTLGTGTYGQVYLCYDPQSSEFNNKVSSPAGTAQWPSLSDFGNSLRGHNNNSNSNSSGCGSPTSRNTKNNVTMYAVKVANKEAAYRRSALNESKVLQLLIANQQTVKWIDTYEENGHICIVTELLSKTVYEIMKEGGFKPLPLVDVRHITCNVLKSLAALHRHDYMHCDVKPENIMLRSANDGCSSSCLIDFGAVRTLKENNYFDIQSLWYRAPEVLCSVPYTPKIDSWSMGCLLYELAIGSPLFPGNGPADELNKIVDVMGSPSYEACQKVALGSQLNYCPGVTRKATKMIDERIYQHHGRNAETEALVDLVYGLLNPDEALRLSCEAALSHSFISGSNNAQQPFMGMMGVHGATSPSASASASLTNNPQNTLNIAARSMSQPLGVPQGIQQGNTSQLLVGGLLSQSIGGISSPTMMNRSTTNTTTTGTSSTRGDGSVGGFGALNTPPVIAVTPNLANTIPRVSSMVMGTSNSSRQHSTGSNYFNNPSGPIHHHNGMAMGAMVGVVPMNGSLNTYPSPTTLNDANVSPSHQGQQAPYFSMGSGAAVMRAPSQGISPSTLATGNVPHMYRSPILPCVSHGMNATSNAVNIYGAPYGYSNNASGSFVGSGDAHCHPSQSVPTYAYAHSPSISRHPPMAVYQPVVGGCEGDEYSSPPSSSDSSASMVLPPIAQAGGQQHIMPMGVGGVALYPLPLPPHQQMMQQGMLLPGMVLGGLPQPQPIMSTTMQGPWQTGAMQ